MPAYYVVNMLFKLVSEVVKAFVRLRQVLASHKDVVEQLTEIRSFMLKQSNKTDREFKKVWNSIENMITANKDESIGFKTD